MKNKKHMIMSKDSDKAFDKIQNLFIIKTLNKVSMEGTYLDIIKAIYDKPTGNIILSGENLKGFSLRSGTRMSTLATCIQHNIGSPSHSNQIRKIDKITQI